MHNYTMASTPAAAVPFVITFGFNSEAQTKESLNVTSAVSTQNMLDRPNKTFIRHLQMHPDR